MGSEMLVYKVKVKVSDSGTFSTKPANYSEWIKSGSQHALIGEV
jgi:hypothetical protein